MVRRQPDQPLLVDVERGQLGLADDGGLGVRVRAHRSHLVAEREVDRPQPIHPDRHLQRRIRQPQLALVDHPHFGDQQTDGEDIGANGS